MKAVQQSGSGERQKWRIFGKSGPPHFAEGGFRNGREKAGREDAEQDRQALPARERFMRALQESGSRDFSIAVQESGLAESHPDEYLR